MKFCQMFCCCCLDDEQAKKLSGQDSSTNLLCSCLKFENPSSSSKTQSETVKLLLLGLDNAGKTTLALHLAKESVEDVVSTIGFSKYELKLKNSRFQIVLYDLGGGPRIRTIWKNYYSLVHGIVFVIDSVDIERILEIKELLNEIIPNPLILGKPILVLLNKQDLYETMDEIDVCKFTNLEELVTKYQCVTKIESITAKSIQNVSSGNIDLTIEKAFQWLLNTIDKDWLTLNERVEENSRQQINRENDTMRHRIAKTQKNLNFIDVETKVPIASVDHDIQIVNNQSNIISNGMPSPKILITNGSLNSNQSISYSINNIESSSTLQDQQKSSTSPRSGELRSALKKNNKVYPT